MEGGREGGRREGRRERREGGRGGKAYIPGGMIISCISVTLYVVLMYSTCLFTVNGNAVSCCNSLVKSSAVHPTMMSPAHTQREKLAYNMTTID